MLTRPNWCRLGRLPGVAGRLFLVITLSLPPSSAALIDACSASLSLPRTARFFRVDSRSGCITARSSQAREGPQPPPSLALVRPVALGVMPAGMALQAARPFAVPVDHNRPSRAHPCGRGSRAETPRVLPAVDWRTLPPGPALPISGAQADLPAGAGWR